MQYVLVTAATADRLTDLVNQRLADGWTLWGPPFYTGRGVDGLGQALVLTAYSPAGRGVDHVSADLMFRGPYGTA